MSVVIKKRGSKVLGYCKLEFGLWLGDKLGASGGFRLLFFDHDKNLRAIFAFVLPTTNMRCIAALILCIISVITAADKQHIVSEEGQTCHNEDGSCESPQTAIQKIIFYDVDNGSLTINSQQTYTAPFRQFGSEMGQYLRDIAQNVQLLGSLADNNLDDHVQVIIALTNDLSSLGVAHKTEWLYDTVAPHPKSFDKTVAICKAELRLFNLLKSFYATNDEETSEYRYGIATAAMVLGDLYQLRPSVDSSAVVADDYSIAHQYFTFAEKEMVKTLSSFGIDENGNLIDGQEDVVLHILLEEIQTVQAQINLRFGSLLLEMYHSGFTLDLDNNIHHHDPSASDLPAQQLSEDQKQILHKAYIKFGISTVIHMKVEFNTDVVISLADAYSGMGTVKSLLHEWAESVENYKTGTNLLTAALTSSQNNGVMVADDIIATMITISQSMFEAYLHLPGEIESAKGAFQRHLLVRQAAGVGDVSNIFGKELTNEDEEEVRQLLLLNKDTTPSVFDNAQAQEYLNMYQNMLEETLHQPGIHYSELDLNGRVAYDNSNILYEGSLRSVIGSLYLDLDEPWKARDELESAVQLLAEGIELIDSGKFELVGDDGKQLTYSLRLDLARVLHSLSYTHLDLMQWGKSYDVFEEAMDIYQSELMEGESPMDWNSMATTTSSARESSSITDRLLNYFFRETEDTMDLEDFQQVYNTTA